MHSGGDVRSHASGLTSMHAHPFRLCDGPASPSAMKLGLVGGTGKEGSALAVLWAKAGHEVILGSRTLERAESRARELSEARGVTLAFATNEQACLRAEIVVLCVPYAAHAATLTELKAALRDRILVDLTVPLKPPKVREVHLPAGQSAAQENVAIVDPSTRVVAAFHHVSSVALDAGHTGGSDALVCGEDSEAKAKVIELAQDLGMRGLDAGGLRNAVALESLTPVLLYLNKRYGVRDAGIVVTGLKS